MNTQKLEVVINQLKRVHKDMNDCSNKFILKDAIDQLQEEVKLFDIPVFIDCRTCKHQKVSKFVAPCYGCRDNGGYDNFEGEI